MNWNWKMIELRKWSVKGNEETYFVELSSPIRQLIVELTLFSEQEQCKCHTKDKLHKYKSMPRWTRLSFSLWKSCTMLLTQTKKIMRKIWKYYEQLWLVSGAKNLECEYPNSPMNENGLLLNGKPFCFVWNAIKSKKLIRIIERAL